MDLVLHGYWRSTASYRVRIAMNLKGLDYQQISHDLRTGAQSAETYRALNPQAWVPALVVDGTPLTQSPAILEWLEDRFPTPALLPVDPQARAIVRAMMNLICCDIHPLNNLRILSALRADLAATEAQVSAWMTRWISDGFNALDQQIARHGRGFAYGDRPTLADCCLVPQVYSAERFGVSLTDFPAIRACVETCRQIEAFQRASPAVQPDAD